MIISNMLTLRRSWTHAALEVDEAEAEVVPEPDDEAIIIDEVALPIDIELEEVVLSFQ